MNDRRYLVSRFAILLSCAAFGIPLAMSAAAAAEPPLKVGVVLPLTSVLASYGKPYQDAIQMAIDEANNSGGIGKRQIELVVEDSQASNTVAINALNKVLQSAPVALFGAALGTQILAMLPTTEKDKIPLIGGPSTRRVSQQGAKYFFRNSPQDAIGKDDVTRFLVDVLGKRKIGIMHVANEWGYSGRDNVTDLLQKLYKLKPVSIASYQPTDKDLTAQILQMRRDGADAVVLQGHPVDEALSMRQMKQLGLAVPVVGSGSLCFAYLRNLVDLDDIAGNYCEAPGAFPSLSADPNVKKFEVDYKAKTGFEPEIYAMQYYDSAKMLIEVMRKYGVDREKIREGMSQMAYQGLAGTYRSDEEGNLRHDSVVMQFLSDKTVKVVRESH